MVLEEATLQRFVSWTRAGLQMDNVNQPCTQPGIISQEHVAGWHRVW